MALATKDPDNDERLNPGAWDESTGGRLSAAEDNAAFDDMTSPSNYNKDADSASENVNIEKARAGEERGTTPKSDTNTDKGEPPRKGKLNETRDNVGNKKDKLALNLMKKKGPLGLIGLLLGGGGGLFVALLSPGLAIVQLKEALVSDLSDSVAAMDERAQHVFRAKTKKQVSRLCNSKVTIKCKYSTMSERQVKKLAAAGIFIEEDKDKKPLLSGRHRVESFVFRDTDGSLVRVTPDNFKKLYRENAHFRSLMNKYYAPRWMAVRDGAGKAVMAKFKLATHRLIGGKDKNEMKDRVNKSTREGAQGADARRAIVAWDDETGKQVYLDPDNPEGDPLKNPAGEEMDPDQTEKQLREFRKMTGGGMNTAIQGVRASSWIFAGEQTMCTWRQLVRIGGTLVRNVQYAQYMRYSMNFINTADSIILGTATPEAVEFVGDIITKKDMRDKVLSEASVSTETASNGEIVLSSVVEGNPTPSPEDNPHKGADAFDHPAVRASMYGGGGGMDMRSSLTSFSTGIGNIFSRFLGDLFGALEPPQGRCDFWRSPTGIVTGIGLGVASLALSTLGTAGTGGGGGIVMAGQIAKAAAVTGAFMIATHMLQSRIMSSLEGDSLDVDTTYGFDAGGGTASGVAAFTASSSSTRGLRPLSTIEEIQDNSRVALQERQRYAEVARIEATDTPFDIHNQHSFLGSMAWNLAPAARKSSATVATMILSPLQILAKVPNWLAPGAHAITPVMSAERYNQCQDEEIFKESNLNVSAPDMMCNLRFGLSDEQRNADPEKVVQWMIDSCQIDPITGDVNESGSCPPGCEPGSTSDSSQECYRTTNPDEATAMLNSSAEQIASAMRYDDEGIDKSIASENTTTAERAGVWEQLPGEMTGVDQNSSPEDVRKDVRTYAHYLRYCRYGPEDGRQVNFGDPDTDEEVEGEDGITRGGEANSGALKSLGLKSEYNSIGKECFSSNNCDSNNPEHDNPNEAFPETESMSSTRFCRSPQYDIYEVYTLDKTIDEGMDQEDEEEANNSGLGDVGDAQEMARQVLAEENIILEEGSKKALQRFADTGEATNACDERFALNPHLLWVMLENAKDYKIKVNNFGFKEDRFMHECIATSGLQHPRGNAIDLNGVVKLPHEGNTLPSINFSGGQISVITEYTADWMNKLHTIEPTRGRVGQIGCGGFNMLSHPDRSKWKGPDGNLHFNDECNHLHIEATDREDINKDDP